MTNNLGVPIWAHCHLFTDDTVAYNPSGSCLGVGNTTAN